MTTRGLGVALVALLLLATGALVWWRCEGEQPAVEAPQQIVVGRAGAALALEIADPGSGLRETRVALRHARGEHTLFERADYPGHLLSGASARSAREVLELTLEPEALGLAEGQAFLDVVAVDWSWASFFAGNTTRATIPVIVDLTPPQVWVETGLTYVRRGGAAAVVYSMDEAAERDGVLVGDAFFAGFPFPGAEPGSAGRGDSEVRRFALFAVPRNAPEHPPIRVVGMDVAGNQTAVGWPTRVQQRGFEEIRINLDRRFLEAKVPTLAATLGVDASDPVAAFREINAEVRARDEERIQEIVAASTPERHFRGAFQQLSNSAVTSRFAEHRRYFADGEQIGEATHYGYDLASTAGAAVEASNAGRVRFADRLGIYGNCVVIDHGLGLASLYGHLSRIEVAVGEPVEKGQVIGRSGATGLAGGDHLHFAVLVSGTYVDPKEWWDPKWVREHVEVHLEARAP